jgi:hypothetical protein
MEMRGFVFLGKNRRGKPRCRRGREDALPFMLFDRFLASAIWPVNAFSAMLNSRRVAARRHGSAKPSTMLDIITSDAGTASCAPSSLRVVYVGS